MKFLYAPWRDKYVKGSENTKKETTTTKECVFCSHFQEKNDEKHFILRRFNHSVVMINLFPYNAGHLLIMPLMHTSRLDRVTKETRIELSELTMYSIKILTTVLDAEGINTGTNFGKAAGAGIPSHFHNHILPRWSGDTGFLSLIGETKQISFDLHAIYKKLKPAFDEIDQNTLL